MLKIKRSQLKELAKNRFGTDNIENQNQILIMISVSLAARTSYTVIEDEKEIDYERMIELHDKLIELKHLSPLEHCARAMSTDEYFEFAKGKLLVKDGYGDGDSLEQDLDNSTEGWCRNFKGFISYRHIIETQK